MNPDLKTALPNSKEYEELEGQATSHDEVVALREMAQQDLAKTASASADGREFPVTSLGKDQFKELNKDPREIRENAAIDSEPWKNEEK